MKGRRRSGQGFTLLELLMVVVILAILAAIAVPQYLKVVERSRMSEALGILGQIRSSQGRYLSEFSTYANPAAPQGAAQWNIMDFNPYTSVSGRVFYTYQMNGVTAATYTAQATRNGTDYVAASGCVAANYKVQASQDGTIAGQNCQLP